MLCKFSVRWCQIVLFCKRELPSLHVFIRNVVSLTGNGWKERVKERVSVCAMCQTEVSK